MVARQNRISLHGFAHPHGAVAEANEYMYLLCGSNMLHQAGCISHARHTFETAARLHKDRVSAVPAYHGLTDLDASMNSYVITIMP